MVIEAEPVKQKASSYLYFSSLYFVAVGVLYLWGYWTRFDVNILEYINLGDVLKFTAYPIASTLILLLVGAVVGELAGSGGSLPPGGGKNTSVGRFVTRYLPILFYAYVAGTFALFVFGPETKWQALPYLIALPIVHLARNREFLSNVIPHRNVRAITVFMLAVLPPWAYGEGRLKGFKLLEGKEYRYLAMSTTDILQIGDPNDPSLRVKYVGHVNEYVFLLLPDNETLAIIPFDKNRGLYLRRFKSSQ